MAEVLANTSCVMVYEEGEYNLSLRIASIFILLFTSFVGVATPTLVKGRGWKVVDQILMIGKFFGAGVITATGFIHILPGAVQVLGDPCLPEFFQVYTASAGLFALIAVLFTHLMEYLAQNFPVKKKKKTRKWA
jgi:zinc transporter 1/2/3